MYLDMLLLISLCVELESQNLWHVKVKKHLVHDLDGFADKKGVSETQPGHAFTLSLRTHGCVAEVSA